MTRIGRIITCALLSWSFSADAYSPSLLVLPIRRLQHDDSRLFAVTPEPQQESRPGWRRMFLGRSQAPKMQAATTSIGYNVSIGMSDFEDIFVRNNMEMLSPSTVFPIEMLEQDLSEPANTPAALPRVSVEPLPSSLVDSSPKKMIQNVDSSPKKSKQRSDTHASASALEPIEPMTTDRRKKFVPFMRSKETIQHATTSPSLEQPTDRRKFAPFMRGWVRNILTGRLDRWSRGQHVNMAVQCDLKSGWKDLLTRGKLACDATVNADRIMFNAIRMSGGRLEARRLTLNLWSFFHKSQKRFPNQFDFVAHNLTLTQEDLIQSPCIRNGLRRLLTRILNIRGMNAVFVRIENITVLPGKLVCHGVATTILGSRLPFQVRTGLGLAGRGHCLTFPGLELSVSPGNFFVPVLPDVMVDLGHNAQLLAIHLDDTLQLSARVTITPDHTIRIPHYRQSARSYAAQCSVDVGRWLTRLGQFSV